MTTPEQQLRRVLGPAPTRPALIGQPLADDRPPVEPASRLPNLRRDLPAIPAAIKAPELQSALDELNRLRAKSREASAARQQAETDLTRGKHLDREAHAAALRRQEPDPGRPKTDAAQRALDTAKRTQDALTRAIELAEAEVLAIVERRQAVLSAAADRALDTASEKAATLLDQLAAVHREVVALRGFRNWVNGEKALSRSERVQRTEAAIALITDDLAGAR